jgi:iron(III) transport system permease protein
VGVGTSSEHYGLDGYATLLTDDFVRTVLINTGQFVVVTLLTSAAFGIPAAWLVARTSLPRKGAVLTFMTLGVLLPGFLTAMGWVFLLSPQIGMINLLLRQLPGLESVRLSVASAPGMGFVQGLSLTPLFFIMIVDAMRSTDPVLEEAATIHGLSAASMIRKITLPLMMPNILAAIFYVATISLAVFDIPAIIGLSNRVFTISTFLYDKVRPSTGLPAYHVAGAFSILVMLGTSVLIWSYVRLLQRSYRFVVVTGKGYRPHVIQLNRLGVTLGWVFLAGYFVTAQLLPFLSTIWISLLPYAQPPSAEALQQLTLDRYASIPWSLMLNGIRNTVILIAGAPLLSLTFSLLISWVVVRSRLRWKYALDAAAFLPLAIPGVLFALSMLFASLFVLRSVVPLYGTVAIIMIVYVLQHISFGTRTLNGALIGIHGELEESAQVLGISLFNRFTKVLIPLLLPVMASTWLWLALLTYRELTVATFLSTSANITLPVVIWSAWQSGIGQSAAEAILAFMVMAPLVWLYWFTSRHLFAPLEPAV